MCDPPPFSYPSSPSPFNSHTLQSPNPFNPTFFLFQTCMNEFYLNYKALYWSFLSLLFYWEFRTLSFGSVSRSSIEAGGSFKERMEISSFSVSFCFIVYFFYYNSVSVFDLLNLLLALHPSFSSPSPFQSLPLNHSLFKPNTISFQELHGWILFELSSCILIISVFAFSWEFRARPRGSVSRNRCEVVPWKRQ